MAQRFSKRLNSRRHRSGAALVEFAVCMPVIMLLVLGSMEATSAIFVRQALTTSAYEGIREAIRVKATNASANTKAQDILTTRRIKGSRIQFTPADIESAPRGTEVVLEVSAPFAPNSPFFGKVIADRTAKVRTVMVKE